MKKTEAQYVTQVLAPMLAAREIVSWKFEPLKLKLAPKTFYTPDFLVVHADRFALHEVKGHWEDDARVKIKCAAQAYPWFEFVAVKRERGGWVTEWFSAA